MLNLYILECIYTGCAQYFLVLALALTDVISFIIQVSKETLKSSQVWVGMPLFTAVMWFIQTALLLCGMNGGLE